MSLLAAIAIFFVIWWVVLFTVLPWGIRTQEEDASVVPGSNPSSPVAPMLLRKAMVTTVVAAIVFALVYWIIVGSGMTLDDVPFLPSYAVPY